MATLVTIHTSSNHSGVENKPFAGQKILGSKRVICVSQAIGCSNYRNKLSCEVTTKKEKVERRSSVSKFCDSVRRSNDHDRYNVCLVFHDTSFWRRYLQIIWFKNLSTRTSPRVTNLFILFKDMLFLPKVWEVYSSSNEWFLVWNKISSEGCELKLPPFSIEYTSKLK